MMFRARLLLPGLLFLSLLLACEDGEGEASGSDVGLGDVDLADGQEADAGLVEPRVWETAFEPGRTEHEGILVLKLKGTPYEMGVQHAELMAPELREGVEFLNTSALALLEPLAETLGFLDEAMVQSYPAIIEECQGLADVLGEEGWTMERCMALAYGDVILEHVSRLGGCTQFLADGPAIAGDKLIHGRNLDWDELSYLLDYPTVIVRHPEGRIPYMTVGFPGMVAPYSGVNMAGLSTASNEANSDNDLDREGRSHVQMQREILETCVSLEEARAFIESQDHMTAEFFAIGDGDAHEGAVFEMSASHMAVRPMDEAGLVYVTNHFVDPAMVPYHIHYEDYESTKARLVRLGQLLDPGGAETLYGSLTPEGAITVLRDNYNAYREEPCEEGEYVNCATIAGNGCIYSLVFIPEDRMLYMAAGQMPVPSHAYVGFSLAELLGLPDAPSPDPARYE